MIVFSIATLIGTIGAAAVLPFGVGFFLLSYTRVIRNIIPIIFVAAIALAVGVGYPGGSVHAAFRYEIVAIVYNQRISVVLVFLFVAAYFATRGMSYLLSTFFITLFVLSLITLSMPPGATSVAQIRVVDTLIGADISLLTVSIIIARHRSLSTTVWQV